MHVLQTALTELLNSGDYDFHIRSYSGRGMYGRTCLAITLDSDLNALELGFALAHTEAMADDYLPAEMRNIRTDTMGLGTVLYWPNVQYVQSEQDEDIED